MRRPGGQRDESSRGAVFDHTWWMPEMIVSEEISGKYNLFPPLKLLLPPNQPQVPPSPRVNGKLQHEQHEQPLPQQEIHNYPARRRRTPKRLTDYVLYK